MDAELKQSFLGHIRELRTTLIWCFATVMVIFLIIFSFFNDVLLDFLLHNVRNLEVSVVYTTITEALATKMKVSFIAAFIASFPFLAFFFWRFLAPALYRHERRIFATCFFVSLFLFAAGVVFAYYVVLPFSLSFFVSFGTGTATAMLTVSKYVSFLMGFVVPFGLVFLTPLIVYALTKLGLITPGLLIKTRKYMLVVLLIIAAILTPPDVVSQLLLFFPMMILWEAGIIVAKRTKPLRDKNATE